MQGMKSQKWKRKKNTRGMPEKRQQENSRKKLFEQKAEKLI